MDFNIFREVRKMLELMDKSKTVKHFMWFWAIDFLLIALLWRLPDILLVLCK